MQDSKNAGADDTYVAESTFSDPGREDLLRLSVGRSKLDWSRALVTVLNPLQTSFVDSCKLQLIKCGHF